MNTSAYVKLPFTRHAHYGSSFIVIGARPQNGRQLYSLQIIKNYQPKKVIAKPWCFFVDSNPISIGSMIKPEQLKKVNHAFLELGSFKNDFVNGLRTFLEDRPPFILIDHFEKLFPFYSSQFGGVSMQPNKAFYELKKLSREFDTPIIITTHLFNITEDHVQQRPMLIDFQSTSLEIAGDQIYALYRPEYYGYATDPDGESVKNKIMLIQLKGGYRNEESINFYLDDEWFTLYPADAGNILRMPPRT